MNNRIPQLPHWCIADKFPAFYDTESITAIEQTAKLYATMQKLIEDYNKFVTEVNTTIETFINDSNADQEEFECRMTKVIHDYLDYLDTKLKNQDKIIADAVSYMKENLKTSITELIAQMHESGEFDEAVLNAIDNMGARIVTLETKANEFETRIVTLETNKPTTEYDAGIKKLTIHLKNEGSVE